MSDYIEGVFKELESIKRRYPRGYFMVRTADELRDALLTDGLGIPPFETPAPVKLTPALGRLTVLLVEIAKLALSTHAEIRSLRGISLSDRDVDALARVVEKGLAIPEDQWPKRPPRAVETPGEAAMAALITAVLHSYCDRHSLAHSLVATKRSIHELVQHNRIMNAEGGRRKTKSGIQHSQLPIPHSDKVQLLRGWRSEAVGGMLSDVLAGHHCVRVGCFKGEPCVDLLPVPPVAGADATSPQQPT
ncbi:MAG: hypothetical protein IID41_11445 [Planctomycetes bacterium]|nr:hypothetical protein [Planctomycetota bacterium]